MKSNKFATVLIVGCWLLAVGYWPLAANAQRVTYRFTQHYNERVELFDQLDDIDSTKIVMLGNSLTENAINIIDLALRCGLAKSKSELRRLIQQGGLFLNGEAVSDIGLCVTRDQLSDGVKLRKGKKVFHKAILS